MKQKEYEIYSEFIFFEKETFLEKLEKCKEHAKGEKDKCGVLYTADSAKKT